MRLGSTLLAMLTMKKELYGLLFLCMDVVLFLNYGALLGSSRRSSAIEVAVV